MGEWIGTRRSSTGMYPLPEQEQIEQYAEAFYGLAKLFQKMPCQKECTADTEIERMFGEIHKMVCADCMCERDCWKTRYFESCTMLYELLKDLEHTGELSQQKRKLLEKSCLHPQPLTEALENSFLQIRRELLWKNRMMEQRTAAGEQIFQTAELLHRAARGFLGEPEKEQVIWKKLHRELKGLGIELGNIRVFVCEGTRTEIYLSLRAAKKVCVSTRTIAEALSDYCGEKMCPAWNCRAVVEQKFENFHFVPETRFQMTCGISRIRKSGELVSGDNYAFLQKDTGKVVMSLADGMGSGVRASLESEKVIELLEQFLDAGFPQETAVRMINSCMLLQNQEQMYSTIDLCMVDLYNAECDLMKSGAAPSYLGNGEKVEAVHSVSIPTGVMQQSDYESMHRKLGAGGTIVMVTDGVLEALPEANRDAVMTELICKTESGNAKEHARRLMERVYLMQKLQARDDMTILIGKLWEK